jgi:hypothetical protein
MGTKDAMAKRRYTPDCVAKPGCFLQLARI